MAAPASSAPEAAANEGAPQPERSESAGYRHPPGSLRPYRSYVEIISVSPFTHHFAVWQRSGNKVTRTELEVLEGAGGMTLNWGNARSEPLSAYPPRTTPPSNELAGVFQQIHAERPGARIIVFGGGREVQLQELMPVEVPGGKRPRYVEGWTELRVNRDFSSIERIRSNSFTTFLHGKPAPARESPFWVGLPVQHAGKLYLTSTDPLPDEVGSAILGAARDFTRGRGGKTLAQLHEADSATLLPPGMQPVLRYDVPLIAVKQGRRRRRDVSFSLPARTLIDGPVEARGEAELEGVQFEGSVKLQLKNLPIPQAPEQVKAVAKLTLTLKSSHGHELRRDYELHGPALVEDGFAVVPELVSRTPSVKLRGDWYAEIIELPPPAGFDELRVQPRHYLKTRVN